MNCNMNTNTNKNMSRNTNENENMNGNRKTTQCLWWCFAITKTLDDNNRDNTGGVHANR